ncbi:MAG: T9SS type A sorting domain-containing protein [Calditrichaeota bacterium]|nr:T9SS type A sorting domain-containing protein [Calditrichota bacterium]
MPLAPKVLLLVLLLGALSLCFAQSKGGRWQFENNGDDTADWDEAGNPGSLINAATYADFAPPAEGSAFLWLDSSNAFDYFRVDDGADLDFDNESVGISAWIYPLIINDVHYLVNKGVQDSNPKTTNYALRISPGRKLEFLIRDANNQAQVVSSDFEVVPDAWNFVAAYYDFAAGKVYLGNDPGGYFADTLDFSQNILPNDGPLSIGSWYRANPNQPSIKDFEGRMDDVRVSGRLSDLFPGPAALDDPQGIVAGGFSLAPNFPNPFNPETTISAYLPVAARASLEIYDLAGRRIAVLEKGGAELPAGRHTFSWNGHNEAGKAVASGVYLYRLTYHAASASGATAARRMHLVR